MNLQRTNTDSTRDSLYDLGYLARWMRFDAWQDGNVSFWLDEDGEVVAYLRWNDADADADGIEFFEVRDRGCGLGSRIIRDLQAEQPKLYISGDLDSAACARFWHRLGLVPDAVELFDGRTVQLG